MSDFYILSDESSTYFDVLATPKFHHFSGTLKRLFEYATTSAGLTGFYHLCLQVRSSIATETSEIDLVPCMVYKGGCFADLQLTFSTFHYLLIKPCQ
jgi:hypothetical protein